MNVNIIALTIVVILAGLSLYFTIKSFNKKPDCSGCSGKCDSCVKNFSTLKDKSQIGI
ncbi:MAG: FeoB-associated Cys-rich membrane protein [Bacteroidales bacterium]|nr:FeoB-associated Cys-rich membrane protein [Bacteroidales bacterium]